MHSTAPERRHERVRRILWTILRDTTPMRAIIFIGAVVFLLWFPISLYRQSRWQILPLYLLLVVLLALWALLLTLTFREFPFVRKALVALLIAGVLAAAWLFVGSSNITIDILAIVAALLVAFCCVPGARERVLAWVRLGPPARPLTLRETRWVSVGFLGAVWLFLTVADDLVNWHRGKTPKQSVIRRAVPSLRSDARLGVALSGGGYRAALFHAGVLNALDELGVPVRVMSTVSGGSIIGAFYARGGAPADFLDAMERGRFNLKRQMLHVDTALHLLASARIPTLLGGPQRFLLLDGFSRTQVQAELLDNVLLNGVKHHDSRVEGRPELMVVTTDIAENAMIGITPSGVVYQKLRPPLERLIFANPVHVSLNKSSAPTYIPGEVLGLPGEKRLSSLVAASGAFPGAFNAYAVNMPGEFSAPLNKLTGRSTNGLLLVDGGVADNFGIVLLGAAKRLAREAAQKRAQSKGDWNPRDALPLSDWDVDFALLSDGSAFPMRISAPKGAVDEVTSAIDLMYSLTAGPEIFTNVAEAATQVLPVILVSPRTLTTVPTIYPSDSQYLNFGFDKETAGLGAKYWLPHVSLTETDPSTVSFMIDQMDPARGAQARELFNQLVARNVITPDGWSGPLRPYGEPPTPEGMLWKLVNQELDERMRAFVRTSTLDDRIDRATARSIYLLGKYLTLLNKPSILCHLERARELRTLPDALKWRAQECRVPSL